MASSRATRASTSNDGRRWRARRREPLAAAVDPVASVGAEIDNAFSAIVRSLEGGVLEASGDPERLRDVRIGAPGRYALNPEMMTLTTEAMSEAPTTPGGEPWHLADLMAVDRQVSYDNVARRVTRLKLFRVLSAIRDYIHEQKLDTDEPMLRDPNALLRRLVRDEILRSSDLLDPWAHDLVFVRDSGPRVPFLSVVPGQRLISAGPDGRIGTADDVRDPFQRVLASRTPYAKAVEEDRLVDARWDMQVGDDTVAAWKETLEERRPAPSSAAAVGWAWWARQRQRLRERRRRARRQELAPQHARHRDWSRDVARAGAHRRSRTRASDRAAA